MQETFDEIFPLLMEDEGVVYEDDPDDPGGATKFGITFDRLKLWRKTNITKNDVRNLTMAEAKEIYKAMYWDFLKADELPLGLDYTVFDFGVNSGPSRSARMLQQLVGADVDGQIGPDTLSKVEDQDVKELINKFNTGRKNFLKKLNTFWKYGKGWIRRVDEVNKKSLELAS